MRVLIIYSVVLLATFAALTAAVWLGACWMKASCRSWRGATAVVGLLFVLNLLSIPLNWALSFHPPDPPVVKDIFVILALVAAMVFVVKHLLGTTIGRASVILLMHVAASICTLVFVMTVVRPFLAEMIMTPTGSMMPTIRGQYTIGSPCGCGGTVVVPMAKARDLIWLAISDGVCEKCLMLHPADRSHDVQSPLGPDRVIVDKLATPRRWDIVAQRASPGMRYVRRLAGLPGETVFIEHGQLWVNDQPLATPTSPDPLRLNQYTLGHRPATYATRLRPLVLGPTECFLIGDYPEISNDSRMTGPALWASLEGVVTVRYWPFSRFRVWR